MLYITIDGVTGERAEFWTDSNGLNMMRRITDYYPNYIVHFDNPEDYLLKYFPIWLEVENEERNNVKVEL